MKKLTVKQLTIIRNVIIAASMIGGLIAWFALPYRIQNNGLIHVGTGKYGSKIGLLLCLFFPLFALIPNSKREEIHTEDPEERKILEEEQDRAERKIQISAGLEVLLAIFIVYALWIAFAK